MKGKWQCRTLPPNKASKRRIALLSIHREGENSNADVQVQTKLHPSDVTALLAGLRERGLLEINNKNRWATYRISKTVTETYKEKPIKKTDKEKLGLVKSVGRKNTVLLESILTLSAEPRSAQEIADAVGRSRNYVSNQCLSLLIRMGRLSMTDPANPKSRNQKYVVKR
jgi:DNA-binding transcriptional ArsR family regulator